MISFDYLKNETSRDFIELVQSNLDGHNVRNFKYVSSDLTFNLFIITDEFLCFDFTFHKRTKTFFESITSAFAVKQFTDLLNQ